MFEPKKTDFNDPNPAPELPQFGTAQPIAPPAGSQQYAAEQMGISKREMNRAANYDPVEEEMNKISSQRSLMGKVIRGQDSEIESFLQGEGSILLMNAGDKPEPAMYLDSTTGEIVDKDVGPNGELQYGSVGASNLKELQRKSKKKGGFMGTGDYTEDALAAQWKLPEEEKLYKATKQRMRRMLEQRQQVEQARKALEIREMQIAQAKLGMSGSMINPGQPQPQQVAPQEPQLPELPPKPEMGSPEWYDAIEAHGGVVGAGARGGLATPAQKTAGRARNYADPNQAPAPPPGHHRFVEGKDDGSVDVMDVPLSEAGPMIGKSIDEIREKRAKLAQRLDKAPKEASGRAKLEQKDQQLTEQRDGLIREAVDVEAGLSESEQREPRFLLQDRLDTMKSDKERAKLLADERDAYEKILRDGKTPEQSARFAQQQLAQINERFTELTKDYDDKQLREVDPKGNRTWLGELGANLKGGYAESAQAIGAGIQWAGNRLKAKGLVEAGEAISGVWGQVAENNQLGRDIQGSVVDNPKLLMDPKWWIGATARMVPGMAMSMAPGGIAAKGIRYGGRLLPMSAKAVERLAKIGRTLTAGSGAGVLEGGQTYLRILEETGDEKEAARAAEAQAAYVGIVSAIAFNTILGKKMPKEWRGKFQKIGMDALLEGGTEYSEEPFEVLAENWGKIATGKEVDEGTWERMGKAAKDGLNVLGPAMLTGGGLSAIGGGSWADVEAVEMMDDIKKITDAANTSKTPLEGDTRLPSEKQAETKDPDVNPEVDKKEAPAPQKFQVTYKPVDAGPADRRTEEVEAGSMEEAVNLAQETIEHDPDVEMTVDSAPEEGGKFEVAGESEQDPDDEAMAENPVVRWTLRDDEGDSITVDAKTMGEALQEAKQRGFNANPTKSRQESIPKNEENTNTAERQPDGSKGEEFGGDAPADIPGAEKSAEPVAKPAGGKPGGADTDTGGTGGNADGATSASELKPPPPLDQVTAKQKTEKAKTNAKAAHRAKALNYAEKVIGDVPDTVTKGHDDVKAAVTLTKAYGLNKKAIRPIADILKTAENFATDNGRTLKVQAVNQSQFDKIAGQRNLDPKGRSALNTTDPQGNDVIVFNTDYKMSSDADAVAAVSHDALHSVGRVIDDFIKTEWQKLKPEQRRKAADEYGAGLKELSDADLTDSFAARQEWFAFQGFRLLKGEVNVGQLTQSYGKDFAKRVSDFVAQLREYIGKWVGSEGLSSKEMDAKIAEVLGNYAPGAYELQAGVAQSGEQGSPKPKAEGSIPSSGANPSITDASGKKWGLGNVAQLYIDKIPSIRGAVATKNARTLLSAIQSGEYSGIVHPDNKASRDIFQQLTGIKLPKTVSGTQELFKGENLMQSQRGASDGAGEGVPPEVGQSAAPTKATRDEMGGFIGDREAGETQGDRMVVGNFNRKKDADAEVEKSGGTVEGYLSGKYKRGWVVTKPATPKAADATPDVAPKKPKLDEAQQKIADAFDGLFTPYEGPFEAYREADKINPLNSGAKHWLMPNGTWYAVGEHGRAIGAMEDDGFVFDDAIRVVDDGDTIFYEGSPNKRQRKQLRDVATFNRRELKDDDGDIALFTPQESEQQSIPADRVVKMATAAQAMIQKGVTTPAGMVAEMDTVAEAAGKPKALRPYARSFWRFAQGVDGSLPEVTDWQSVFNEVDGQAEISDKNGGNGMMRRVEAALVSGEKLDRRQLSKWQEELGLTEKQADEWAEAGVVIAARKIIAQGKRAGQSETEIYDRLVDLYDRQPNLTSKTSESKIQQAYSTPMPFAYLASRMAGINEKTRVLEPTAGHGALLIEATPKMAYANELNDGRRGRLEAVGVAEDIDGSDATGQIVPANFADVLIANPPFGTIKKSDGSNETWTMPYGGETTNIDYQIIMQQLEALKDGGRAVFLYGGLNKQMDSNPDAREKAYANGQRRQFLDSLYGNYNVIDYFTVSGDLYRKMGAGWPIDVIVVDGRGKSKTELPYSKNPRILKSWDDLRNELTRTDAARIESRKVSEAEVRELIDGGIAGIKSATAGESQFGVRDEARDTGDRSDTGGRSGTTQSSGTTARSRSSNSDGTGSEAVQPSPQRGQTGSSADATANDGQQRSTNLAPVSNFNSPYKPAAKGYSFETLIPKNMASAAASALQRIEREKGMGVNDYVREKLQYGDDKDFPKYFAAEQVDALALALYQSEQGAALVVGDQTGIGKGRVAAGMIRYAVKNGKVPIFVTNDPKLYAAMIEDLEDIGSSEITPLFTNNALRFEDHNEKTWKTGSGKAMEPVFNEIARTGKMPKGKDVIFTSYSQIQSDVGGKLTKADRASLKADKTPPPDGHRMKAIKRLVNDGKAVLIMDEAHKASGDSISNWRLAPLTTQASDVLYLSATFAKRPDSMSIYMRTDMRKAAGGGADALVEAMHKGGTPLQQAVSSMLTESGQYIRRERDFEGAVFRSHISNETAERDRRIANNYVAGLREIFSLNLKINGAVQQLNRMLKKEAKSMSASAPKVESTNFASKIHNMVSQYLVAIKAKGVAQQAIKAINEGVETADGTVQRHKVIATVFNTMEAPINDAVGSKYGATFKGLLSHYLDQQRYLSSGSGESKVTVYVSPMANLDYAETSDAMLVKQMLTRVGEDPDTGKAITAVNKAVVDEYFRRIVNSLIEDVDTFIENMDIGDLPISPIDAMRHEVEAAGIRTGELTGRGIRMTTDGEIETRDASESTNKGKLRIMKQFNNEDMDFLVLNGSASTGVSLHASEKFARQDPRMMIIAQAHPDINEFMQTLGRIHRSGQVEKPYFLDFQTAIPAELRPAAVRGKKMSSLNANTTSNADSDVSTSTDAIDIFNKYGDEIIHQVLMADPELVRMLGFADKLLDETGRVKGFDDAQKALMVEEAGQYGIKVTGRMAIMSIEEQDAFWSKAIEDYKSHINYLNELGQNDLIAEELDLKAETIERTVFTGGGDSESVFDGASYMERVNVEVGEKPPSGDDVIKMADKARSSNENIFEEYETKLDDFYNKARDAAREKSLNWDKRKENWEKTHSQRRQTMLGAIREIGSLVKIGEGDVYGAVVDFKIDDENLLAPSKHFLVIQTNSGKGRVRMPFSMAEDTLKTQYPGGFAQLYDNTMDWSSERLIITGNLLAAYTRISETGGHSGKIVTYTTKDGEIKTGILLPSVAAKEMQAERDSRVYLKKPGDFQSAITSATRKIRNADETVTLTDENGVYSLKVPASKRMGGKYWQDPELNKLTEDGLFRQVGDKMVAAVPYNKLPGLFEKLDKMGESLFYVKPSDGTALFTPQDQEIDALKGRVLGDLTDKRSLPEKVKDATEFDLKQRVRKETIAWTDNLAHIGFLQDDKFGVGFTQTADATMNAKKLSDATRMVPDMVHNWLGDPNKKSAHQGGAYRLKQNGDIEKAEGVLGFYRILHIAQGNAKKKELDGRTRLFELYLAGHRGAELLEQGREHNFGLDRAGYEKALAAGEDVTWQDFWSEERAKTETEAAKALDQQYPEFARAKKEYEKWNKALLDFMVASGSIDPARRAEFESANYAPFFRIQEAVEAAETIIGPDGKIIDNMKTRRLIRRLEGGTGRVAILENVHQQLSSFLTEAYSNLAKQSMVKNFSDVPSIMEPAPHVAKATRTNKEELVALLATQRFKELEATGQLPSSVKGDLAAFIRLAKSKAAAGQYDLIGIADEADWKTHLNLWRMHKPEGKNILTVNYGGKPRYYRVNDQQLYDAIQALGPDRWEHAGKLWLKFFSIPKNTLTWMVTKTPAFVQRNGFRDTLMTWAASPELTVPGFAAAAGAREQWRQNGLLDQLGGAGIMGSAQWNVDGGKPLIPKNARKHFMKMAASDKRSFLDSIVDGPKKAWRAWDRIVQTSEMMNRVGLAKEVVEKGGSNLEAAWRANDITNFHRHGGSNIARFMMHSIPFLNARLQGLYFLKRSAGGRSTKELRKMRNGLALNSLMMTSATLALLALNWDDEEYWKLPEWIRDTYWNIRVPGTKQWIRIPKPFELGAITATAPERIVIGAVGNDLDRKKMVQSGLRMFTETFALQFPVLMQTGLEQWTNYSWFRQRPIISRGEEFSPPEDQHSVFTPEFFKQIAEEMPDSAPPWMRSPKRIEHAFDSLFGSIGAHVIDGTDMLLRRAIDSPERPKRDWRNLPLMRDFATFYPSDEPRASQHVSDMWDLAKEAENLVTMAQRYREQGNSEKARNIEEKDIGLIAANRRLQAATSEDRRLSKAIRDIYSNETMSGEEKARRIDQFTLERNQKAKQTVGTVFPDPR